MSDSSYIVFNNFGAGAESCAGFLLWVNEPDTRPIDPFTNTPVELNQIISLVALTGLEYESTKEQVEQFIFPVARLHNMRFIQVGRGGSSFNDGIIIVEDSCQPETLWFTPADAEQQGLWTLGDEFDTAAVLPKLGRPHACAMKYKGFVLDWTIQIFEYLARIYGPRNVPPLHTDMQWLVREEQAHLLKAANFYRKQNNEQKEL